MMVGRTSFWRVHISTVEGTFIFVCFGLLRDTSITFGRPFCFGRPILLGEPYLSILTTLSRFDNIEYEGDSMAKSEGATRRLAGKTTRVRNQDGPVNVTVDQVKVLSDPSRLRILTLLLESEMSISGIAKALGLTPATVHHHMSQLLAAKLIEPGRAEVRGNLVEKYYRLPATGIDSGAVWEELSDADKVNYRLAVLGMLKGLINESIKRIQEKGTVDFEVGRLYFYHVPWRRDTVQQVVEILEETKRKFERLEAKARAQRTEGDEVMVVLTTLPV